MDIEYETFLRSEKFIRSENSKIMAGPCGLPMVYQMAPIGLDDALFLIFLALIEILSP